MLPENDGPTRPDGGAVIKLHKCKATPPHIVGPTCNSDMESAFWIFTLSTEGGA